MNKTYICYCWLTNFMKGFFFTVIMPRHRILTGRNERKRNSYSRSNNNINDNNVNNVQNEEVILKDLYINT